MGFCPFALLFKTKIGELTVRLRWKICFDLISVNISDTGLPIIRTVWIPRSHFALAHVNNMIINSFSLHDVTSLMYSS